MQGVELLVVPRKVQRIHQAEIRLPLLDVLAPFWPTHFVGYLDDFTSVLGF